MMLKSIAASLLGMCLASGAWAADAYFSPSGADGAGSKIGVDCTLAVPCKTVSKALSFLAANIAGGAGPNRNYTLLFDGGSGPFYLASQLTLTSAHTVAPGYMTYFDVYNGAQAAWSGGSDTAGTWRSAVLPSGASGCVSSYLTRYAPLKETNAKYYVGAAWINGHRVQEVINPRSGNPWAKVPGVCTATSCVDASASVFVGPTAGVSASNPAIRISDLSRIGIVGDTIQFEGSAAPLRPYQQYWIRTKSAATGSGTITLSTYPGGATLVPSASATINVADPIQTHFIGDRGKAPGKNRFPYDPAQAEFASAYNQTDVKAEFSTYGAPSLGPVFSVSGGVVTLDSRMPRTWNMYPTTGYRVWNRFEDLGSGGYQGELYTNRTTGLLYYTPRSDLGETCASINAPGKALIPASLETLVKISSAAADIAVAGGVARAPVGNFTFQHILFEHANSSIFTGVHDRGGAVGGFMNSGPAHFGGPLNWAVVTIGASNVTFNVVTMAHFGGSALAIGWGSNHVTVANSKFYDAGGSLITAGGGLFTADSYHYPTASDILGTAAFGPSTPSVSVGDPTGASDCCQKFINNFLYDAGIVAKSMPCMSAPGWRNFTIAHNTMHDCGTFAFTAEVYASSGPPGYYLTGANVAPDGTAYYPYGSNNFSYNEIYNCGYETTIKGIRIPGGAMGYDFGCFYITGPQDLDGTNTQRDGLKMSQNKIHDVSSAAYPYVTTAGKPRAYGRGAELDYWDTGVEGVVEYINLFYNRSAAAVGAPTYPNGITQHTGNLRNVVSNNIFAGVFAANAVMYADYLPRGNIAVGAVPNAQSNYLFGAGSCNSTCYVMSGYNI